jgi:hypothetical protein
MLRLTSTTRPASSSEIVTNTTYERPPAARTRAGYSGSGLYRHFDEDSARLAKLGIKVDVFAGCVVTEGIVRYRFRYNSTIYSYYVDLVGKEITEEVLGSPPVDELSQREEKG